MNENSKWVKKLDDVFSKYIRQLNATEEGITKCYTCGKYLHWKQIQCGHYISRRHFSTRWFEKNCKPQCVACNVFNQGNGPAFAEHLVKEYGYGVLELLTIKKNNICKMGKFEFDILIKEYQQKLRFK